MNPITTDNTDSTEQDASSFAQISIGTISIDSDEFPIITELSIFPDYMIKNHYEKDSHIYMAGLTSPGGFGNQSVGFGQISNPTLLWICEWTADKWGDQPEVPDPTPADSSWQLMDEHYDLPRITVGPDGTSLYRISGIYFYGKLSPSSTTINDVSFPRPPWLDDTFDRTMPGGKLTGNLSNIIQQPGSGPSGLQGTSLSSTPPA